LHLFFICETKNGFNTEIGLTEMNAEMELSIYKTLFNLPNSYWNVVGIENLAIVLAIGHSGQDKKLTFYRAPIR
jgi:hypothetical protein